MWTNTTKNLPEIKEIWAIIRKLKCSSTPDYHVIIEKLRKVKFRALMSQRLAGTPHSIFKSNIKVKEFNNQLNEFRCKNMKQTFGDRFISKMENTGLVEDKNHIDSMFESKSDPQKLNYKERLNILFLPKQVKPMKYGPLDLPIHTIDIYSRKIDDFYLRESKMDQFTNVKNIGFIRPKPVGMPHKVINSCQGMQKLGNCGLNTMSSCLNYQNYGMSLNYNRRGYSNLNIKNQIISQNYTRTMSPWVNRSKVEKSDVQKHKRMKF